MQRNALWTSKASDFLLLSSVTGVLNEVCSQTPVGTLTKAQTVAIPSTESGEAGGKICLRSIKKPAFNF